MTQIKEKTKMVKTISGKTIDRDNACLIDKEYYEKNVDCAPVLEKGVEKWYPIFNSKIAYDFTTKTWNHSSILESKGLKQFLIGFHQNNVSKKIFGYDHRNPLLDVCVKSHYNEVARNLKNYEKDLITKKELLQTKKAQLNKEVIFNGHYSKFLSFLAKLRYYVQVMEKSYNIKEAVPRDFFKIINEVDSFVGSDSALYDTFKDFEYCYKLYTDVNQPTVEQSVLEKITYNSLKKNEDLNKVFDVFISFIGIIKAIENEIKSLETSITTLNTEIEKLSKLGYFSLSCRSKEEALSLGFVDSNKSDFLFYKKNLTREELEDLKNTFPVFSEGIYKTIKINYNASSSAESFNKIVSQYHQLSPLRKVTKDSYKLAKLLKGLSFGIEFETSCGRLREQDLSLLGVIPLRDGSIKGFEYTTVPYGMKDSSLKETDTLNLAKDLNTLQKLCSELTEKTKINNSCSMHLHIGGARKDKLYLIALYMLAYRLQDEMFLMQPMFKIDSPKYLGSQKNYCQKLDHLDLFKNCIFDKSSILKESYCNNVDLHFNNIFKFLSGGFNIGSKFNRKTHVHPYQRKWERTARYHWINLVNCVFSDSGTIEFRLHSSTLNFTKVLNWLLICAAIVKYAETHTKEIISGSIKNIDLDTVLFGYSNNFRDKKNTNAYGLFVYNYLKAYVRERNLYFKEQASKGLFLGLDDMEKDSKYEFNFKGISSLI